MCHFNQFHVLVSMPLCFLAHCPCGLHYFTCRRCWSVRLEAASNEKVSTAVQSWTKHLGDVLIFNLFTGETESTAGQFPVTESHSLSTVKQWKSGTPCTCMLTWAGSAKQWCGFSLVWSRNIPSSWPFMRMYQLSFAVLIYRAIFLRSLSMLSLREGEVCATCLCTSVKGAWHHLLHW